MSCQKIQKLLVDSLDESLNTEEVSWVRGHLDRCAFCSQKLRELKRLRELMSKTKWVPKEPFFETFRKELFEKIRRSRPSKEWVVIPFPQRRWKPLFVLVTLALILSLAFPVASKRYQAFVMTEEVTELALMQELEGEVSLLELEDPEFLAEEIVMTDELLSLAQAETTEQVPLEEEIELLETLGEGEELEALEEMEDLEEEIALTDEALSG